LAAEAKAICRTLEPLSAPTALSLVLGILAGIALVMLEVLHLAFMLLSRFPGLEGAKVLAFVRLGVGFAGIETIFA
jgi:hypothetical protein